MLLRSALKLSGVCLLAMLCGPKSGSAGLFAGYGLLVLIQKRRFLMGTNAVQGSAAKIDHLSD